MRHDLLPELPQDLPVTPEPDGGSHRRHTQDDDSQLLLRKWANQRPAHRSRDQPQPMRGQYYLFRVWAKHLSRHPDTQSNNCPDSKCQEACVQRNILLAKRDKKLVVARGRHFSKTRIFSRG